MQPINNTADSSAFQPSPQPVQNAHRPPPASSESEPAPKASPHEVTQAAKQVEKFVQSMSSDLKFTVDESSGVSVVKVVDRATQELIRQIPSEEMLTIAKALDRLQGLLVRQQA